MSQGSKRVQQIAVARGLLYFKLPDLYVGSSIGQESSIGVQMLARKLREDGYTD
jgi:hypothetical protein